MLTAVGFAGQEVERVVFSHDSHSQASISGNTIAKCSTQSLNIS